MTTAPDRRPAIDDLLRLSQWMSPAFPTGGFAYSHGLDWAIDAGEVHDAASLSSWIAAVLSRGSLRNDLVLLSLAHQGRQEDRLLSDWAGALAASAERWQETRDLGAAFERAAAPLSGTPPAGLPLPVAVGVHARRLSLDTVTVGALFAQSTLVNLVQIGVRIVPLGQTAGQGLLADAIPQCHAVARAAAAATGPEAFASAMLGADIAAMRHETQHVRLFRT